MSALAWPILLALLLGPGTEALKRAREAVAAGRLEEAAGILRGVLDGDPSVAEAHHLFGVVLVRAEREARALEHLRQAVALAPDRRVYRYTLGATLFTAGMTEEASTVLLVAVEGPGGPEPCYTLGRVRLDLGDAAGARCRFLEALGRDPAHRGARYRLALLDLGEGRWAEAEAALAALVREDGADRVARQAWGRALILAGRVEEGRRELDRFRQEEEEAHARRAAEREAGRVEECLEMARRMLGEGRTDEALRFARHALDLVPEDPRPRALIEEIGARLSGASRDR